MTKPIPECILIKYILIYNNYIKYYKYININKEQRELSILYQTLRLLQERYPNTDKTVDELEALVWASYPNMRLPEKEAIHALLETIKTVEVRDEIALDMVTSVQRRAKARELAMLAMDVSEGTSQWEEFERSASEILDSSHSGIDPNRFKNSFAVDDIRKLKDMVNRTPGLHWRLHCLNRSLGPLRLGNFGFIFARPESGKTTFLADQISYMASQVDRPILWLNNEQESYVVQMRIIQSTVGMTRDEMWQDDEGTNARYMELTKGLIRVYPNDDHTDIYKSEAEDLIEYLKPSLIVMDQIDKIKGFDADRNDLVYGKIYQWARSLAKKYAPVIGVCQADGSGDGVKWLTMSHVADAKTAKQAEADWILGIGASNEDNTDYIRYFNISKNKLFGDERTDPAERHGRYHVYIKPDIGRYEDIAE